MSRIVGVLAADAARRIGSMVDALHHGAEATVTPTNTVLSPTETIRVAVASAQAHRLTSAHDGPLSIVFDGVLSEVPGLPEAAGDAEAVLALYTRHGLEGCLERLTGDFAFALLDQAAGRLVLARDRTGLRPLFWAQDRGVLAFASRPRPLIDQPEIGRAPNRRWTAVFAGGHYRYIDNEPAESPYEKVHQVPAATALIFDLSAPNNAPRTLRYWSLTPQDLSGRSEADLAEAYRDLLMRAVGDRLRAATAPGFTLSGGMDSSSVLASSHRISGAKQHAFSAVYTDKTFDESDEIQDMLGEHVARWTPVRVDDPDVFAQVAQMVAVHDEPVATATWLSHFTVCQQVAAAGHDVLFGGLGGDELNAGEYEYFFNFFADLRREGLTDRLDAEIDAWAHHHDHPIYRKSRDIAFSTLAAVIDPERPGLCLPDRARLQRYFPAINPEYFPLEQFEPVMEAPFTSYLSNRTWQDISRETAPCCLRAEDRHAHAHGLETRSPFYDHRLVEFMFGVPAVMKIRDGVTKHLLREAMAGVLPEATRTRIKKVGWNAPAHLWFSGGGGELLRDLVASRSFRERGLYDAKAVEALIVEHDEIVSTGAARDNHMMFFWQLVNVETWLGSLAS